MCVDVTMQPLTGAVECKLEIMAGNHYLMLNMVQANPVIVRKLTLLAVEAKPVETMQLHKPVSPSIHQVSILDIKGWLWEAPLQRNWADQGQ